MTHRADAKPSLSIEDDEERWAHMVVCHGLRERKCDCSGAGCARCEGQGKLLSFDPDPCFLKACPMAEEEEAT